MKYGARASRPHRKQLNARSARFLVWIKRRLRLESDTIGGFNSMLAKQQEQDGECRMTTVLFDNEYEVLHDRIDIKAVSPITEKEYFVRGATALLDAIGRTIHNIGNMQKQTAEEYRAEKVLFVITTDGMENASREYTYSKVKSQIERRKS